MTSFQFLAFSQRDWRKSHNEDAVLLDNQVYQGSVREGGVVDAVHGQSAFIGNTATHFAVATASESLAPLLRRVQQDYVVLSNNPPDFLITHQVAT